jgi:hypothetical protein
LRYARLHGRQSVLHTKVFQLIAPFTEALKLSLFVLSKFDSAIIFKTLLRLLEVDAPEVSRLIRSLVRLLRIREE